MNSLMTIWLVMRAVSWALMVFILVYVIGDASLADTGRAIIFMKWDLLVPNPVAAGICAALWIAWAVASWRFLFSK